MSQRPIDLHAHVEPTIAPAELTVLRAVIFAASRTLDESEQSLARDDGHVVWGVGCHPAKAAAHSGFEAGRFSALIERAAFVSEIGLDGAANVPMARQEQTLRSILEILQGTPRIASVHSYRASTAVLDVLTEVPIEGAVLHWWLGDDQETARAVEMGCWFSVNASSVRRSALLQSLPLDRILTETDHPFGDRRNGSRARPGAVSDVEAALATRHGLTPAQLRSTMWENLGTLVSQTGVGSLLPRPIRLALIAR